MEQHPIPQDIKSFQFKLVGDMTLRQFVFLAGGLIVAYLAFILPLHFFLKWPTILLSLSLGIGCAFLPINGRPLDQWIIAFLKAIFSPTQRIWQKTPRPLLPSLPQVSKKKAPRPTPSPESKLEQYLASFPKKEEGILEEEKRFLAKLQPFLSPGEEKIVLKETNYRPSVAPAGLPLTQPVLKIKDHLRPKPKIVPFSGPRVRKLGKRKNIPKIVPQQPSLQPEEIFTKTPQITEMAREEIEKAKNLEEYKKEIERLRAERERLLREAQKRKEEARRAKEAIARLKRQTFLPPETQKTPTPTPTPQPLKKLVLPKITNQANIINGVVADREGNLLEGVIVIVKDKDGNPVRALRTNSLGQFATATPLPQGLYSIEAEKEGYHFDIIYQEIKGGVLPPLEIRAK